MDGDRAAVLVIVEDRDPRGRLQVVLHREALRGRDVLEDDPPETGGQAQADLDDLVAVPGVQGDGHGVHAREGLEEDGTDLEHGKGRFRAGVADAVDRRPVADHGDGISPARQFEGPE